MNLKLGLVGKGHQGQRYLDPINWPTGVEVVPFDHAPRSVRGVIVATPADKHHEFALFAMEKLGLPVLVEKPTHANPLIGMEMLKVSRETKVPLYTAFPHWFSAALNSPALRKMEGELEIYWRGPSQEGCDAVVDWGSHAYSIKYMLWTLHRKGTSVRVMTGEHPVHETRVSVGKKQIYAGELESPTQMSMMLRSFARVVSSGFSDEMLLGCQSEVLWELLKCVS